MTTNQINLRKVKEEERHNLATEAEERRHNLETEGFTAAHYERSDTAALQQAWASASQAEAAHKQIAINAINAETQRYVAETGRLSYYEGARHNVALEEETIRHNTATEQENAQHNRAQEAIGRTQAAASTKQAEAAMKNAKINAGYLANETAMNVVKIADMKGQADRDKERLAMEQEKAFYENELKKAQADKAKQDVISSQNRDTLEAYKANLEGLKFKESTKKESHWYDGVSDFWGGVVEFFN